MGLTLLSAGISGLSLCCFQPLHAIEYILELDLGFCAQLDDLQLHFIDALVSAADCTLIHHVGSVGHVTLLGNPDCAGKSRSDCL